MHFFFAGCSDQYVHITGGVGARANHTEVETHFVQGKRDVLVGFGFDLHFELQVTQATRQDDALGDDSRGRQCQRHIFGAGATLLDQAAHSFGHLIEFFNVAVHDPATLQRLDGTAFQHKCSGFVPVQLHQLHAG